MENRNESSNTNKSSEDNLRPHILFLFADQLRADFIGCCGSEFVNTPNINALAAEGIQYNRAYSPSPLCVPARCSLLLGMDAVKTGVLENSLFIRPDYGDLGLATWPELLTEAGYETCAVGKMHFYPWDASMGFTNRIIAEDKRWHGIRDDYAVFLEQAGYKKQHAQEHPDYFKQKGAIISQVPWEYTVDHFVGESTCGYIRRYRERAEESLEHNGKPLALMVGFPGPHCPYDPSEQYLSNIDPESISAPIDADPAPRLREINQANNRRPWNGIDFRDATPEQMRTVRRHYAALVEQIDYEVGQIVSTLRETGLYENTLIILASDHGDYLGDFGMVGKNSFFDPSCRVPLIVKPAAGMSAAQAGAGEAEAGEVGPAGPAFTSPVSLTDVNATILSAAGVSYDKNVDSIPLPGTGIGTGGGGEEQRASVFGCLSRGWMICEGRWKLSRYRTGESVLADLEKDPEERDNLYYRKEYADKVRELEEKLSVQVMESLEWSHREKTVYTEPLTEDPAFGARGWKRPYPHPVWGRTD
jgi:arylsulfatase A-like enzyme